PTWALVGAQYDIAGKLDGNHLLILALATNHNQVADAPLGQLAFDARHPGPTGATIGANSVQEDAGVADVFAAVGLLSPLVLDCQVIITVLLVRGEIAIAVSRNVQQAILDRENPAWICALAIFQPGVQAGQVLAVEERDDALRRAVHFRLVLLSLGQGKIESQTQTGTQPVAATH